MNKLHRKILFKINREIKKIKKNKTYNKARKIIKVMKYILKIYIIVADQNILPYKKRID